VLLQELKAVRDKVLFLSFSFFLSLSLHSPTHPFLAILL